MSNIERAVLVAMMLFISIAAITWIGHEYYALCALFELMIGFMIGMIIFLR